MAESYDRLRQLGQDDPVSKKEQAPEAPRQTGEASYSTARQMGQETLRAKEAEITVEKKEQQEKKSGKGMWGASGAALGLVAVGIPLATGQILKYSLFGWRIGSRGIPELDTKSLADFDRAYRWASGTKKS